MPSENDPQALGLAPTLMHECGGLVLPSAEGEERFAAGAQIYSGSMKTCGLNFFDC